MLCFAHPVAGIRPFWAVAACLPFHHGNLTSCPVCCCVSASTSGCWCGLPGLPACFCALGADCSGCACGLLVVHCHVWHAAMLIGAVRPAGAHVCFLASADPVCLSRDLVGMSGSSASHSHQHTGGGSVNRITLLLGLCMSCCWGCSMFSHQLIPLSMPLPGTIWSFAG